MLAKGAQQHNIPFPRCHKHTHRHADTHSTSINIMDSKEVVIKVHFTQCMYKVEFVYKYKQPDSESEGD